MSSHRIAVVLLAAAACGPTQDLPVEGTKQQAIEFCGSTRVELTTNPPARFFSTGLISNGCTGVLLDAEHVLAAAHCFTT